MLMNYRKTFVAVLVLLGIVASMGWFATVQAGGAGELRFPIQVTIAVKPGAVKDPPRINPGRGVIPVAIFSTCTLAAAIIDPATVGFGPESGGSDPVGPRRRQRRWTS